jgi:hypothetical protein
MNKINFRKMDLRYFIIVKVKRILKHIVSI